MVTGDVAVLFEFPESFAHGREGESNRIRQIGPGSSPIPLQEFKELGVDIVQHVHDPPFRQECGALVMVAIIANDIA